MKQKKSWTVEDVLALEPCQPQYSPENLMRLFAGRKKITFRDALEMDVPDEHKIWFTCRVFSPTQRRIFGGLCALSVLENYEAEYAGDKRIRECIAVVLSDTLGDEGLSAARAVRVAASAAASAMRAAESAMSAARAASAAWSIAVSVEYAVAIAAERAEQAEQEFQTLLAWIVWDTVGM